MVKQENPKKSFPKEGFMIFRPSFDYVLNEIIQKTRVKQEPDENITFLQSSLLNLNKNEKTFSTGFVNKMFTLNSDDYNTSIPIFENSGTNNVNKPQLSRTNSLLVSLTKCDLIDDIENIYTNTTMLESKNSTFVQFLLTIPKMSVCNQEKKTVDLVYQSKVINQKCIQNLLLLYSTLVYVVINNIFNLYKNIEITDMDKIIEHLGSEYCKV